MTLVAAGGGGGAQMRLLLVTTRDVKPGEQLFWNYRVDTGNPAEDDSSDPMDDREFDTSQESRSLSLSQPETGSQT